MVDRSIRKLIVAEAKRQAETINLIPSENFISPEVLRALGSVFTNKYAEGYSAARYYGGNQVVDQVEELAKSRALDLFCLAPNKWQVNVQPYSGSTANMAVYVALVPVGGKIMGLELNMGGHLTHGHKASFVSKAWQTASYGLDRRTELLDYGAILKLARKEKPKLIVAGYTAYPRIIDFKKFRAIADAAHAYLMVDMSHFAGLVAGEAYPSPFAYADVVTTTTHKTLRGPRGAMIFSRSNLSPSIDHAVFPGLQGGPHVNQIAGTAAALLEAKQASFKLYAKQIIKNAKVLAGALQKEKWRIVSGGTDTHLLLVDVAARGISGKEASDRLERQNIIVNKNTIPFDTRSPVNPSGIRLGTPTLTTRGMGEKEMKVIARLISEVLLKNAKVTTEVKKLCKKFPLKF